MSISREPQTSQSPGLKPSLGHIGSRLETLTVHPPQFAPPQGRVDARGEQPPRRPVARLGTCSRHVRIGAERKRLSPRFAPVPVLVGWPEAPAYRPPSGWTSKYRPAPPKGDLCVRSEPVHQCANDRAGNLGQLLSSGALANSRPPPPLRTGSFEPVSAAAHASFSEPPRPSMRIGSEYCCLRMR